MMLKSICIHHLLLWIAWNVALGADVVLPAIEDNQIVTTLTTVEDESDSEPAEATQADGFVYNGTTDLPGSITTMNNEYFDSNGASGTGSSSSNINNGGGNAGTIPRDRMGPLNAYYLNLKDRPKSTEENSILRAPLVSLSSTSSPITETSLTHSVGAIAKPTKYHYYPHNQHVYLLPECAVQQVCSAVYVRLNYTQPLCACPSRYREPCSASLNSDDLHTTELSVDAKGKVLTLVKTCEPVKEMRLCRAPRDWSLLALQNVRTGKSHYLVICHCPETSILEGPTSHDQPTYASVPGIKVYGMVCINKSDTPIDESQLKRKARLFDEHQPKLSEEYDRLTFPYHKLKQLLKYVNS